MNKRRIAYSVLGAALLAVSVTAVAQQAKKARASYVDPAQGFTIQAPRFPKTPAQSMSIPVTFQAPPEDGFAANVTVAVQAVKMTRKQYAELTKAQFEQAGVTVKAERTRQVSGKEAIEWEYENEVQGKSLHFLQLAVMDTDRVFLATCTAPTESFPKHAAEFRASLASLKLVPRK